MFRLRPIISQPGQFRPVSIRRRRRPRSHHANSYLVGSNSLSIMQRLVISTFWSLLIAGGATLGFAWLPPMVSKPKGEVLAGRLNIADRTWQVTVRQQVLMDHVRLDRLGALQFGGPLPPLNQAHFASIPINLPSADASPYLRTFEVVSTGWPWRCFRAERSFDLTTFDPLAESWAFGAVLEEGSMITPLSSRVLPFEPIWPAMAGNASVFFAGSITMFLVVGLMRRIHRRAHGKCAHCGYDLGKSDRYTCPECGPLRS